jgi:hypothetical protein
MGMSVSEEYVKYGVSVFLFLSWSRSDLSFPSFPSFLPWGLFVIRSTAFVPGSCIKTCRN